MLRKILISIVFLTFVFVSTTPAAAISYGEFDGNAHPNVGSIVILLDGVYYQWCSGTLISDTLFLTASHCTAPLDGLVHNNPTAQVLVTFDPTIHAGGTFYAVSDWHTNPAYTAARGNDDPGDVAVMNLAVSPGITPAQLPAAGLLDELKDAHVLNNTLFTAVGYGTVRETNHTGWQAIQDNMDRNRADQEFQSLTPAWLTNSMNMATGNGGTCYGDSGGPHFVHLDGAETNIVVSVTVTGDANCKSTDKTYRVDTEAAREFLSGYISLP